MSICLYSITDSLSDEQIGIIVLIFIVVIVVLGIIWAVRKWRHSRAQLRHPDTYPMADL